MPPLTQAEARRRFPALLAADRGEHPEPTTVFLDNAGGSQVPQATIDAMTRYLAETYVQLGADYRESRRAVATVEAARGFVRTFMGGDGIGEVVLGPSTSTLCYHLAEAFARAPKDGRNEIVVCDGGHESNIGPWCRLANRGFEIRWWQMDRETTAFRLEDLDALLSERTSVVAMHHVSNLLGRVEPVADVCRRARAVGARTVIDGVAFAPHRAVDVAALGADFYVFSAYKVFGPHMAALFGRHEAFAGLVGPNHYFVPEDAVPYRWELGGVNHEGCGGLLGTAAYLAEVAGVAPEDLDRSAIAKAFARFQEWEAPLQAELLGFLEGHPDYRVIGPGDGPDRVATVSFTYRHRTSRDVAEHLNAQGLSVRYGHFYAHHLTQALDLDPDAGVLRASLVHYNTLDDVRRLTAAL